MRGIPAVATAVVLAGAAIGPGAQARQSGYELGFHTYRTTNGCLFRRDYIKQRASDQWTWSGRCTPGQLISGFGSLRKEEPATAATENLEVATVETGQLVNGLFNGEVKAQRFQRPPGGQWTPRPWLRRDPVMLKPFQYRMGCIDIEGYGMGNCTPASGAAIVQAPPVSQAPPVQRPSAPAVITPAPARPTTQGPARTALTPAQIAECDRIIKSEQLASRSWPGDVRTVSERIGRFQFDLFTGRCAGHPQAPQYIYGAGVMLAQAGIALPPPPLPGSQGGQTSRPLRPSPSTSSGGGATAGSAGSPGANGRAPQGRQQLLNPETGQPCLTEVGRDRKDIPYYIEHGITLANSCAATARVRIQFFSQGGAPREQEGVVYGGRQHRFWCLQYKDASRYGAQSSGCMGVQGYVVNWD